MQRKRILTWRPAQWRTRFMMAVLALVTLTVPAVSRAATRTWIGPANGDWFTSGNWDPADSIPQADDTVIIPSGASVLLTNETAALTAFSITNATLTFSNWVAALHAVDVDIWYNANLTHAAIDTNAAPGITNRVFVVCTDIRLWNGAEIDVKGRGFVTFQGPGSGSSDTASGGSYGGKGGGSSGPVYGSPEAPANPGSASRFLSFGNPSGAPGGGLVWIEASGDVRIDGLIDADGNYNYSGGGSGGGIRIECATFRGSGTLRARGEGGQVTHAAGGGGGGRIAVLYDPIEQANVTPKPTAAFSVIGGVGSSGNGESGTLYFPDPLILGDALNMAGRLLFGNPAAMTFDDLTVSLSAGTSSMVSPPRLVMPADSMLTVSGTMQVSGNGSEIELLSADGLIVGGDLILNNGRLIYGFQNGAPESLSLGGALSLTNAARLSLHAGVTNQTHRYGGQLDLSGRRLSIPGGCNLLLYSNPTNGGSIKLQAADILIDGTVDAAGKGFQFDYGPGRGTGTTVGGSYGGKGGEYTGSSGPTYGSAMVPVHPGSGGSHGGRAGGLVLMLADGTVEVNGTVTADGDYDYTAANSGGGILIVCRRLTGTGTLRAVGGSSNLGGWGRAGGGGGRIAVLFASRDGYETARAGHVGAFRVLDPPAGWDARMIVDGGDSGNRPGAAGTKLFGYHAGTLFIFR